VHRPRAQEGPLEEEARARKKVIPRCAAGAALALNLALTVADPVAAGKKSPPPTGDNSPPTTATNLQATSVGQTSVTLAWNASTDNSGSVTYVEISGLISNASTGHCGYILNA